MSLFRIAPVTAECLIVLVSLFMVGSIRSLDGESFDRVQNEWGAITLRPVQVKRLESNETIATWNAPTDLWNGHWWRIPVSAFHHRNAGHLLLVCAVAWAIGGRLEQRWGSLRFGMFLILSAVVPLAVEFAVGNGALGFSGALCAWFGALIADQQEEHSDDDLSEEMIQIGLGAILLGIPVTALGIADVPNVAHVSGVAYGWLFARIQSRSFPPTTWIRIGFAAAHLVLVPAFWLATHPIGYGRYFWYLAERSGHREEYLKLAIEADPTLSGVWVQLADSRLASNDVIGGWTFVVNGLSYNPTEIGLMNEARRIWMRMRPGDERESAEAVLERIFKDRAKDWSQAIRNPALAAMHSKPKGVDPEIDIKPFSLDQAIDLQWQPKSPVREAPPPMNPERPDSAVEGTAL